MQVEMLQHLNKQVTSRCEFWTKNWDWPESTSNFIFLGDLVQDVGKAIYGEAWTGDEPSVIRLEVLPNLYHAEIEQSQLLYPCSLLSANSTTYAERCASTSKFLMPTDSDWVEAVGFSQERANAADKAYMRFYDVCHRLVFDFKRGTVVTALRRYDGGPIESIASDAWNTNNWFSRFHTCQLDINNPYSPVPVPNGGHWIFVEYASFISASKPVVAVHQECSLVPPHCVSPYLDCMIRATAAMAITDQNQPKKAEIEATLPTFWNGPSELSANDIRHMATFMRSPDRKLGKGRKTKPPLGK